MMIAKLDRLFLQQDAQKSVKAHNRAGLCHIFVVVNLLLNRLQHFPDSYWWPTPGTHHHGNDDFMCPKTVANLEHLLQCLRQATLDALISDALNDVDAGGAPWYQYWQQSKTIFQGWFSEWPNGQRPLNTTWPWNVKPSLVVLWGVCWMFYDDNTPRTRRPPPQQPPPPRRTGTRQQLMIAASCKAYALSSPFLALL